MLLPRRPKVKVKWKRNTEKKGRGKKIKEKMGFSGLAESEVDMRMEFSPESAKEKGVEEGLGEEWGKKGRKKSGKKLGAEEGLGKGMQ